MNMFIFYGMTATQSPVIYAVYFTVAWSVTQMKVL